MNNEHNGKRLCQNDEKGENRGENRGRRINGAEREKPFSGFIIIRLNEKYSYFESDKLEELAKKNELRRLLSFLENYKPQNVRRVVKSVNLKKLRELESKARQSEFAPLHSLSDYWRLDFRSYDGNLDELVRILNELPEVDLAYKETSVTDPVVNAGDDTFAAQQGYLDAAPDGIDARWAWTQPNGEGAGVGVIDLEQGWIPTHEDLAAANPTLVFNDNRHNIGGYLGDHGTAVLGEIVGVDNNRGVVGIAPSVSYVRMVSHYEAATATPLHVADAIVAAITNMNVGDVLLLEVQRSNPPLPTETDSADFDAIRLAVANGIVVVEAAGNGNNNLDNWTNAGGLDILDRGSANFTDSGAIMVGASVSPVPHDKAWFSNFGSRVDCYAWGENIVTAGYANRDTGSLGNDATATFNDDYTSDFGGTSGASPIVVGAALILQGMYKATSASVLSPTQMRALLANPATGTPQGAGGNIGVMPNLRAIIEDTLGLVPDVYLRDFGGDTGQVPSAGAISTSPDIIVRPAAVGDPVAEFGEGSGNENSETLGFTVEAGQDNFIYVRIKNRGGSAANNVTADIYWSSPGTLITPNLWNFIGTTAPVNVPVGDTLVVTDALTWASGSLPPADTHQCFVGILKHAQDPAPPIPNPASFDWNDFTAFIRNYNNVTWRNFDVENVDPGDPNVSYEFSINGAPDKTRNFDFEIIRALPEGVELWLEMPYNLFIFTRIRGLEIKVDRERNRVAVRLPALRRFNICNLDLPKAARYKCRFLVRGGKGYERGLHRVAIRQIYRNLEVGRVTLGLKAGKR